MSMGEMVNAGFDQASSGKARRIRCHVDCTEDMRCSIILYNAADIAEAMGGSSGFSEDELEDAGITTYILDNDLFVNSDDLTDFLFFAFTRGHIQCTGADIGSIVAYMNGRMARSLLDAYVMYRKRENAPLCESEVSSNERSV